MFVRPPVHCYQRTAIEPFIFRSYSSSSCADFRYHARTHIREVNAADFRVLEHVATWFHVCLVIQRATDTNFKLNPIQYTYCYF